MRDSDQSPLDVFLSHHSKDKPKVRLIAEALQSHGLTVWLDEWELVPGRPWQEALEEVIRTTHSAAVFVGPDGIGPWEAPEMRACLSQFVSRDLPVIPVILPGAAKVPELPLFLQSFTWVDFREEHEFEASVQKLIWGITGEKPNNATIAHSGRRGNQKKLTKLLLLFVFVAALASGGVIFRNALMSKTPPEMRQHHLDLGGTVSDEDGNPLADVTIEVIEFKGVAPAKTDAAGKYSLLIPSTESMCMVRMRASKEGFKIKDIDISVPNSRFGFILQRLP